MATESLGPSQKGTVSTNTQAPAPGESPTIFPEKRADQGQVAIGFKRQVPSVGRVVLYKSYGTPGGEFAPEARAAVITHVDNPGDPESSCSLAVLNPLGMFFNQHTPWNGANKPGSWDWPPYVPPVEAQAQQLEQTFTLPAEVSEGAGEPGDVGL